MFYKPNAKIPQWEFDAVRARQNPVDEIRHGPANHGTDAAQAQADDMAIWMRERIKQELRELDAPQRADDDSAFFAHVDRVESGESDYYSSGSGILPHGGNANLETAIQDQIHGL